MADADFKKGFNLFGSTGPNYLYGQMSYDARVAIHLTHWSGAIVVFFYALCMAFKLWPDDPKPVSTGFLVVLFTQVLLGVNNVVSSLQLLIEVAHNVVGGMLF